jgi:IS1 family transposase/transposase-like protein
MCEINVQVKCPHCESARVKKNGAKANKVQNFYCYPCKKQFQMNYKNHGANPINRKLVRSMTMNSSGIRDIQRVTGISIVCILNILRAWFKELDEPVCKGHYPEVQIDEMWTFVKHRKNGKRWFWYAYDKHTKKILAFHIGSRSDSACKMLMKKLVHLEIDTFYTDDWDAYKKNIPKDKHVISKKKTTHIERKNRDFRTRVKRLFRKTVCFSKSNEMHYGILKAFIYTVNSA